MAEDPRNESPVSEDDDNSKKKKKKRKRQQQKSGGGGGGGGGVISRFWWGFLGRSNKEDDYEKKLHYLSKEEATVHVRLKRRARSWRIRSRNIIVFSVLLQVIAVAYAIMTTRSVNLDWKMRAARVFPIFGLPILSTLIYSTLARFTRMLDGRDQKTLERLRAERQAKIDELKERTNYYLTQQLIQRYDLDPAAKAAAATVLASKLGADSGLKVYVGDESNNTKPPLGRPPLGRSSHFEMMDTSRLRNRKPAHIRSNSAGNPALTQYMDETNFEYGVDGNESPRDQNQVAVEHFKAAPSTNDGGWLARIAALLVGEDPTQCYALICGNCHMHNGLARKEDFPYITYYCPHCQALNSSQQSDDSGSMSSMGKVMPTTDAAAGVNYNSGLTRGNVTPSILDPVRELPTGDENEVNEEAS